MKRALLVTAASLVLAAGAALLAKGLKNDSRPVIFLRADDPARQTYDRFVETFGDDAFVVVTCRGDTRRVPELVAALKAYQPMKGAPVTEALNLIGEGRVSVPVSVGKEGGVGGVREVCSRFPELKAEISGEPALNLEIERASDAVGRRLFPLLALTMAALLFVAYRSAKVVLAVFLATAVALLFGMACVAVFGGVVNLVTILLPVLLLALTVALSVHLVNAYRLHLAASKDVPDAVRAMVRDEWRPCFVTSLTTAAGFGSFAFARIEPLADLGRAMGVAILLSLGVCFTLLPALLVLLRPRPREGLNIGAGLVRFVPSLLPPRPLAFLILLLCAVATAIALPNVPRETNALHYLPSDNALRVETERLAREGVGTASIELVLTGKELADLDAPIRRIEEEVGRWRAEGVAHVRGVVTPLTVAREAARLLGPSAEAFAFAPAGPLEERLRPFRSVEERAARASILIDPLDVDAYGPLRARIDALVATLGVPAEVTGEFPVVMTVQSSLIGTLLSSLAQTAGMILVILAISMRSIRLATLTLLPAVVPLGLVVVACAVLRVPLSISTVMVLSVALGIVTDNSVHMLHAFTDSDALRAALRRVGTAVTETSIATFLGFLVCVLSDFLPTRHFGLLTAFAMLVALVTDVLLFPALLRPRAKATRDARM